MSVRLDDAPGVCPVLATACGRYRCRPKVLSIRAQLLSLDWARTETAFEREQEQAR
jgi:hypothetical protein